MYLPLEQTTLTASTARAKRQVPSPALLLRAPGLPGISPPKGILWEGTLLRGHPIRGYPIGGYPIGGYPMGGHLIGGHLLRMVGCLSVSLLPLFPLGRHTFKVGRAHSGNENRSGFLSTPAQVEAGCCTLRSN